MLMMYIVLKKNKTERIELAINESVQICLVEISKTKEKDIISHYLQDNSPCFEQARKNIYNNK